MDGSVGVGKSTLLQLCREMAEIFHLQDKICVIEEPVELWSRFLPTAPQGRRQHSALELFYSNPETLSYAFQMYVMITLQEEFYRKICLHRAEYGRFPAVVICERYQNWVARSTFIQDFVDRGIWTVEEMDFYNSTWESFVQGAGLPSPVHWYVQCSPSSCLDRIVRRGRAGENAMGMEALLRLHRLFENWKRNDLRDNDRILNTEMVNTQGTNQTWYQSWVTKEVLSHIIDVCRDELPTANLEAFERHRAACMEICRTLPIEM